MRQRITFLLCLLVGMVAAQTTMEQNIQTIIDQSDQPIPVEGQTIKLFAQNQLPVFYERRGYKKAWTDQENINDLIVSLQKADEEGLLPSDYHLDLLLNYEQRKKTGDLKSEEVAMQEILLTDALIKYAAHLLEGKLEQSELRRHWDVEKNEPPENVDSLLTATLHNKEVKSVLESMKPNHYMYKLMKLHLKKLKAQADQGGWPDVSEGETLKPGMEDPRVLEVRSYLKAVGDLDPAVEQSPIYDSILEQAVKHFQFRHRLTQDGAIGKGTLAEINTPIEDRIQTLRLNLERQRWIFQHPDEDFLIVNIAGFHVKRITNRKEVFDSRVIVGKFHRETPVFKGVMRYIEMNPTWTLPYSIATQETLPHIKKDPGYLAAKHMEVMDRNGKLLDPSTIDWQQYSAGNFPFIIRQKAGPWNALGEVKFMFPNKYAVYLHDTPSRGLFNRQDRAFSHGCIRTEDKWGLLMSLMNDPGNWNMDKINGILKSGKTTRINLPKPVNIYLIYLTAAVDQQNNLMFMRDIYKRDEAVIKALDNGR